MYTINKYFFFLLLGLCVGFVGCVDNDFDEPENTLSIDPSEVISVEDVLSFLPASGGVVLGQDNIGADTVYIKGTVTADDASGNFFKTITFQDATGPLSISVDRNELNAEFPIGNTVYVRLNGLTLGYDANLPRIGFNYEDNRLQRIPDALASEYLFAGGVGEAIVPEVATISQIRQNTTAFYNKLVILEEVEFTIGFAGQTYADADNPDGPQTVNMMIEDCDDNEIILRNSGFADFASEITPLGSGQMTVIVSVFNDDLQLFIRDLDDVNFGELRCDGSGGTVDNQLSIADIKSRYYDLGANEAETGFIKGVVISDRENTSFNNQNIIFQGASAGIIVRFTSGHSFDVGDELEINVSGLEVSEFAEALQIANVPAFNATILGTAALPAPTVITVEEILADQNRYESTRVLINGAELKGGNTYADGPNIDDETAEIQLYTRSDAPFGSNALPSGTVNVTGIVGQFNNPQIIINSPADISGGTVDPGGDDGEINQDFEGFADFDPVNFDGWQNVSVKGNNVWVTRSFDGNGFAECEAFNDDASETEAWLVTATIDTDDKSIFSFETAQAFWQHQGVSVWISQDFTNFDDANWISLDQATIASQSDEQFDFVASGDIDLTDYLGGKVKVAWKYEGTSGSNTTKMRIDNVVLK